MNLPKLSTKVMPDNSEIIPYDEAGIPLYVQYKYLSAYLNSRALCHWHEDMEFSYVKKGRMNYYVNGKNILLRENDCIMVNARQMHYNYSVNNEECEYFGFIFHSSLLTPNKNLYTKYVSPIVENSQFEYQVFNPSDETGRKVLYYLDCILEKKQQATPGYEIEIIGLAHLLWITIYNHCQKIFHDDSLPISSDLSIQKDMVSYIYQHYADKLTIQRKVSHRSHSTAVLIISAIILNCFSENMAVLRVNSAKQTFPPQPIDRFVLQFADYPPGFRIKFLIPEIISFIFLCYFTDHFTWISGCHRPVGNIFCYNTARTDHTIITDMYARKDYCIAPDPTVIPDFHRNSVFIGRIPGYRMQWMTSCIDCHIRCHLTVISDFNSRHVKDRTIIICKKVLLPVD